MLRSHRRPEVESTGPAVTEGPTQETGSVSICAAGQGEELPPSAPPMDGGGSVDEARVAAIVAISRRATPDLCGIGAPTEQALGRLMRAVQHPDVPQPEWVVDPEQRLALVDEVWAGLQPWLVDVPAAPGRRVSAAFRTISDTIRTEWALDEVDADAALADLGGDPVQQLGIQAAEAASAWSQLAPVLSQLDDGLTVTVPKPGGGTLELDLGTVGAAIDLASNIADAAKRDQLGDTPAERVREGLERAAVARDMLGGVAKLLLLAAQAVLERAGLAEDAASLTPALEAVGTGFGAIVCFLKLAVVAIRLADGEVSGEDLEAAADLAVDVAGLAGGIVGMPGLGFALAAGWLVARVAIRQMGQTRLDITGAMLVDELDGVTAGMASVQIAHERARFAILRSQEQTEGGPDFRRAASALAGAVLVPLNHLEEVVTGMRAQQVRGRLQGIFAIHRPTFDRPTPEDVHALCAELACELEEILATLPEVVGDEAGFGPSASGVGVDAHSADAGPDREEAA